MKDNVEEKELSFKQIWERFKTAFLGKSTGSLTSNEAWNLVRYGMMTEGIDSVVNNEISRIEKLIIYKAETSKDEDSLIITVPENKMDLYESIENHFSEKGFICFFTEFSKIPGEKFLIISWKDGGNA